MKPTFRLILLAVIILIFGTVPVVHAVVPTDSDFTTATPVTCSDPPTSWNGEITSADQVDYYSIDLVAGQVLTIDVDAEDLSSLDSLLEVFDGAGKPIGASDDDKAPGEITVVDPYLEIKVIVDGTYYLAISASSKNEGEVAVDKGGNTGSYMLFLQCSDPSNPPGPIADVKVGDLLGTTGSESGSLISIDPDNGQSSLRFPLEIGPIADIDFDPISKVLFAANDTGYPGSIVTINPNDGTKVAEFNYVEGGFVALESAGDTLYGVLFHTDDIDALQAVEKYSLVTISQTPDGLLGLETIASLTWHVTSLAYHSSEKVLYGVASVSSASDLIRIRLEPEFSIETVGAIQTVGANGQVTVVALDFSHENVLYGVDSSGNVLKIDHVNGQALTIGEPIAAVNGLTFVVGEAPPNEEPVKTLCSSSITSATTASSETNVPKLSKLKLKNNPLHRAIGLFKFQGKAGEKITLRLAPEGEETVMAGEESSVNTLFYSWLNRRGKGRVFLGIRDAIPNVDFRARKKDQIPFDMSADLPEDGYYYVMVIRPLLRFYQTDYCLTLESDRPDSEAWQTLDVVWPGDDAEEETTTTLTEAKTVAVQSDELSDEGFLGSEDTTPGETTGIVPTLTGSEPVSVAPATIAPEPVDEGSGQEVQGVEETAFKETGEVAPAEEPTAEAIEEATMMGAPSIPEETTVDETGEVAPAEELTTEATDEPIVMGAPSIPEETTVDETGEVAPAEELTTEATDEPMTEVPTS